MYASKSDVQAWITDDKLPIDDANMEKQQVQAMRLIRGQLTGTFTPTIINTWTDPAETPELIREICSKLTASYLYRSYYAAESLTVPPYAQLLYTEACLCLTDIRDGGTTVIDGSGNPIASTGGILSFFPDDSVPPKFTMNETFA